jgi:glycosyltransferase involved in cell wall biosynthesis
MATGGQATGMRPLAMVVPGRLDTPTGGSVYNRHIAQALARRGRPVAVHELDDTFPYPTPAALAHAAAVFDTLPGDAIVLVDGLALGAMPDVIERAGTRVRIVALVHLPLAADIGIDRQQAARFEVSERRALAAASLIIVTGKATLALLARYGLAGERVVVVEPGTDPAPLARGSGGNAIAPLRLLSIATLNPIKGHEILMAALAAVPHRNWRLTCAGSVTRHPATAARVGAAIRTLGLAGQVELTGELDPATVGECFERADVFVLATLMETYGMAVSEALARGLPVVSTMTGAIPDLVGSGAGLLVPPGDTGALAEALTRIIGDADLRARLAAGARRVRDRLPDWDQAGSGMAAALARLEHSPWVA